MIFHTDPLTDHALSHRSGYPSSSPSIFHYEQMLAELDGRIAGLRAAVGGAVAAAADSISSANAAKNRKQLRYGIHEERIH